MVPDIDFTTMLQPLQDVGVHFLNDAVWRTKADLVAWTGLPKDMVSTFYDHAKMEMAEWEALGRFGKGREVVHNETDEVGQRDSYVEGKVGEDEGEDEELQIAVHRG